jgi:hypothetical protein
MTLKVGETGKITATIEPDNATNKKVNWSTSDENVVTVAANGTVATVTAVAEGTATITVKSEDGGFEATCEVTVKAAPVVEEVFGSMTAYGDGEVTQEGNTYIATFTGEIPWYDADTSVGRNEAGNRVGVKIFMPEDEGYDPADIVEIKIGDNTYEWEDIKDGEDHFQWWPLVTQENQNSQPQLSGTVLPSKHL